MRATPEKTGVTPLIDEKALERRVAEMAREIAAKCEDVDELLVVGLLKGVFVFMADLVRAMSRHGVRQRLGFIPARSYGAGTVSAGEVTLEQDLDLDVTGRTVLLLDDILDTGHTLSFAVRYLEEAGAARVITAVLLDKPSRRELPVEADHVGFEVPDRFVVGYGIDYAELYRYLPYVAVVVAGEARPRPALRLLESCELGANLRRAIWRACGYRRG
jgi:hypoxanthine phosphoribosyltransferase